MKPVWLIERGVYGTQAAAVANEVRRQGMTCVEVDYRPGKPPPDDIRGAEFLPDDACVILWGTLPLLRQIQLYRSWVPGGWCDVAKLDCSVYYAWFGPYLLNGQYTILPGVEAIRLQERIYAEFGPDDEVFVRPSGVHKIFTGTVAYRDDFRHAIAPARYDPATLVVIAKPREIGREWRLAIAGNEIIAASRYRDNGDISIARGCPAEVLAYAAEMLHQVQWRPDDVFMMDICESAGQLHLLELNSFSCSGFYDCDPAALVQSASAAAEKRWQTSNGSCKQSGESSRVT